MLHHIVSGNQNGPAVFMGSSLGTTSAMWNNQLPYLEEDFQVIRFDSPGHGKSLEGIQEKASGESSDATVKNFAAQVLELADHLGIDTFSYVGLSLGGAIGQQLALDAPQRIEKLVLTCTAAKFGQPEIWQDRARNVRENGMEWLREPSAGKWFTENYADGNAGAQKLLDDLVALNPHGYSAACDAVARFDVTDQLHEIPTPTLVIAGSEDVSTPPAVVEVIAKGIPGAEYHVVEGAAHVGNIEAPEEFGRLIGNFLRTDVSK
ncbi:3-oxoadipate enol-lactonase [Corynebacterium occultum]|nr:3-oxoadipate enol-lactonase [Corynebacterium occultum]